MPRPYARPAVAPSVISPGRNAGIPHEIRVGASPSDVQSSDGRRPGVRGRGGARLRAHERPARRVQRDRDARRDARGAAGARPRCSPRSSTCSARCSSAPPSRARSAGSSRSATRRPSRSSAPGCSRRWPGTSSPGARGCRRAPATRSSAASSAPALVAGGAAPCSGAASTASARSACSALHRAGDLAARSARWPALVRDPRRCAGRPARATRRWRGPVARRRSGRRSATLAFSHGANDAQKSVGVIAALLLADGRLDRAVGARVGGGRLRARR